MQRFFMYKLRSCTNDKFKNMVSAYVTLEMKKNVEWNSMFVSTFLQSVAYTQQEFTN